MISAYQDLEGSIPAKEGDAVALLLSGGDRLVQPDPALRPVIGKIVKGTEGRDAYIYKNSGWHMYPKEPV